MCLSLQHHKQILDLFIIAAAAPPAQALLVLCTYLGFGTPIQNTWNKNNYVMYCTNETSLSSSSTGSAETSSDICQKIEWGFWVIDCLLVWYSEHWTHILFMIAVWRWFWIIFMLFHHSKTFKKHVSRVHCTENTLKKFRLRRAKFITCKFFYNLFSDSAQPSNNVR